MKEIDWEQFNYYKMLKEKIAAEAVGYVENIIDDIKKRQANESNRT